jgi:hypothetical protein
LFGDSIHGRGRQIFRVRTGDGEFTVAVLHPDGSATTQKISAVNGLLDVVFPAPEWTCSGLVVSGAGQNSAPAPAQVLKPTPRPDISHLPPRFAVAGQPLSVALRIWPLTGVTSVRLHYRHLN